MFLLKIENEILAENAGSLVFTFPMTYASQQLTDLLKFLQEVRNNKILQTGPNF